MKFQYYLPPEKEERSPDERFLPSFAFTVFSRNGIDTTYRDLQGIFCRWIPQVLKIKMKLLGRFHTSLVIPVAKDKDPHYFLEMESDNFWREPEFLSRFEKPDYIMGGSLSIDRENMKVKLYSRLEGSVIYEREYKGDLFSFFDFSRDLIKDLLLFFEIAPQKNEIEIINNRPVCNPESFLFLLQAFESDPKNNVKNVSEEKFIHYLKKSLEKDPQSVDVSKLLISFAESVYRKGKYEKSEEISEFVLSLQPLHKASNILKTLILMQADRMEEAFSRFDSLAKMESKISEVIYVVARKFLEINKLKPAKELFQKALDFGCDNPLLFDSYSYLLIHLGDFESAVRILERSLEKFPNREIALIYLAQLMFETNRIREAEQLYDRAFLLYPDSPQVLTSLARYHSLKKNYEDARTYINSALEKSPEDQVINYEASRIFHLLGNLDTAKRMARTAIELNPENKIAEESMELLSRISSGVSEEDQQRNRDRFIKALRLLNRNKINEAIKILDEVNSLEPLFWNAWFIKGIAYRRLGQLISALESFKHVEDLFPDQISLHHEIARCLMGLEKFPEAFPHMLYAFQRQPENPEIMANMGLVYLFLGRVPEAEALLSQARKMAPDSSEIDTYLRLLRKIKKRKKDSRDNGGREDE